MRINVNISPRSIIKIFIAIVVALTVGQLFAFVLNTLDFSNEIAEEAVESFYRLFDFGGESNFPAFYSALALLFCGVLLSIIVLIKKQAKDPFILHWAILALGFVYLAIDEAAKLHEMLVKPTAEILNLENSQGVWVLVGIPAVILVGLFYWRFLLHLPSPTRWVFIIAGAIYVFSSIGLEVVSTRLFELVYGLEDPRYLGLTFLEELLEMVGIIIFIYALMVYIRSNAINLHLTFGLVNKTMLSEISQVKDMKSDKTYSSTEKNNPNLAKAEHSLSA